MKPTAVYTHPDGVSIVIWNGRICISEPWDNDNEDCAALPIAPYGMKLLAFRLLALAHEVEASHED
jgi:hypothetical protein